MYKRYLYWSSEGIKWTKWFKWNGPKMPSPFKKLKVEYKDTYEETLIDGSSR